MSSAEVFDPVARARGVSWADHIGPAGFREPEWENGSTMTPAPASPPRRARHLMDPDAPRGVRRDPMSLSQVQKWVMSVLAVTTIEHLSAGLVVAAYFLSTDRPGAQAGLLVIAGIIGMLAVVAGFLIHGRRPVSLWLLLGTVPALVGAWFIYVR